MRIVFMGSDPLSLPFLGRLLSEKDVEVCAVVTQPPRRQGQRWQESAFLHEVRARGLVREIYTPIKASRPPKKEEVDRYGPRADTRDPIQVLSAYAPDLIVLVAYGQILSRRVLDIPPLGCLNIHLSLLPELRGAGPIQQALLDGLPRTGVSAMRMTAGMDEGPVYGQTPIDILPTDNRGSLTARLVDAGLDLLSATLRALAGGTAVATPQDDSRATYTRKFTTDDWLLDWTQSADEIDRRVRAFSPHPGCTGYLPPLNGAPPPEAVANPDKLRHYWGAVLKILAVEVLPGEAPPNAAPGEIVAVEKRGFVVASGDHRPVRLTLVRPDGKQKYLDGPNFVNGYRSKLHPGARLDPDPRNLL